MCTGAENPSDDALAGIVMADLSEIIAVQQWWLEQAVDRTDADTDTVTAAVEAACDLIQIFTDLHDMPARDCVLSTLTRLDHTYDIPECHQRFHQVFEGLAAHPNHRAA